MYTFTRKNIEKKYQNKRLFLKKDKKYNLKIIHLLAGIRLGCETKIELNWYEKCLLNGMTDFEMFEFLVSLLSPQIRLSLFEDYCKILEKRIPERVWLETGIKKTNIYRYLPKDVSKRGGRKPTLGPTAKFIVALIEKHEKLSLVRSYLDSVAGQVNLTKNGNDVTFAIKRYHLKTSEKYMSVKYQKTFVENHEQSEAKKYLERLQQTENSKKKPRFRDNKIYF